MHWNQIEYASKQAVEVWWYNASYRGVIVGVHVKPGHPVRYYVQTSEGVSEYASAQVRRVQQ